jgi:hypothetical protein
MEIKIGNFEISKEETKKYEKIIKKRNSNCRTKFN